jgi:hypothetical protein
MIKASPAKSTAVFIAIFMHNLIAAAQENFKISIWAVSPSAAARLADEIDGDWFSIRPPKGYERVELGDTTAYDRAGIKLAVWTNEGDRSINPTITVMSMPALESKGQSDHELFKGFLKSLTAKWPNAKGSEITEGIWNGRLALRFQFSATSEDDEHIRGVVVCDLGGLDTLMVSVLNAGNADEDTKELATLTNSALSCRLKTSRVP